MKLRILFALTLAVALQAAEIPAGAAITVRMLDPVDSQTAQAGQTFRATLDEPVMQDGRTLLPKGALIHTKLVEVKRAGKLVGKPELTLALASITHEGKTIEVSSAEVSIAGKSRTRKTGMAAGAGAVLGAIIGAIAGGGKGAAIGAAAGAGAGGAYQIFTQGESVKIPAETKLTFTLAHTVTL